MLEQQEVAHAPSLSKPARVRLASALIRTTAWTIATIVCAAYVFYFATLSSYPLQDFPNHLARAVVMADLLFDHGVRFGQTYTLGLMPIPYVLHDLVLSTFVRLFGVQAGSGIFSALVMLSMPLALMFYMRATRLAPRARLFVFLIGLYLATDWFFLMAFMGFRLALAIVIVCLGLVAMLRRQWSRPLFCAYVAVLVVGYLTHLAAPVFFAMALAVSSTLRLWFRATSLKRELYLWLPVAALFALHVGLSPPHSAENPATYQFFWGTWHKKLQHIWFEYTRYGSALERPMLVLLLACLLWPLRNYLQLRNLTKLPVIEPFVIAAGFLAFYFIMPQEYADSAFVDVRALPVVLLMVLLACLNVPGAQASGRSFETLPVLGLAFLLALMNFAFLVRHVGKNEVLMSQYRELGAAVPRGSYVLPIHTIPKDGEIRPLLHAGGYLVADRGAVIPYLFSGDRGDPMKYFRYRKRPYWPDEQWYRDRLVWDEADERTFDMGGRSYTWRFKYSKAEKFWEPVSLTPVDWNRVACRYDYLLMTRPVDEKLISVPTHLIRANSAAALVAVDKSACHPEAIVDPAVRLETEHY
jgi:hypothetical protein